MGSHLLQGPARETRQRLVPGVGGSLLKAAGALAREAEEEPGPKLVPTRKEPPDDRAATLKPPSSARDEPRGAASTASTAPKKRQTLHDSVFKQLERKSRRV